MKLRKLFFGVLAMMALMFTLVACSSDSGDGDAKIDLNLLYGKTWTCDMPGYALLLSFNADGTGTSSVNGRQTNFTYTYDSKTRMVTCVIDSETTTGKILSLTSTQLSVEMYQKGNDGSVTPSTMVFTAK